MEENEIRTITVICFILASLMLFAMGIKLTIWCSKIDIQEIKQVENGYYVTVNDEIYFKEN